MRKFLEKIGYLNDLIARIGAICIVAIMVMAVFMRYAMHDPLQWCEELLIVIFIWVIMLGAVSSMRVRGHVSIDALTAALPRAVQRWIAVFVDIVGCMGLVVLGWLGLELSLAAGDKISPILMIPYTYIDLAVPVGCFWMALYMLFHLAADVCGDAFRGKVKEGAA